MAQAQLNDHKLRRVLDVAFWQDAPASARARSYSERLDHRDHTELDLWVDGVISNGNDYRKMLEKFAT